MPKFAASGGPHQPNTSRRHREVRPATSGFRAWFAALVFSAAVGPAYPQIGATIAEDSIAIESGKITGTVLASGVKAYFGIPYAAPPVRALRWREPQQVKAWSGVFHADRFAPECIQVLRRHNLNHYFGEEATSEDCLHLNVWAPSSARPGAGLTVIVYIYGGGFTIGSSAMALYGGENVAKKGAIFVSFNYRLGALGFMAHPELTAESTHHASGNYGLLDQVAALRWIKANVAQFGGDPTNVTISGQSAGSQSVAFLQASALAKGLFHRAVGWSSSPFGLPSGTPSLADAEQAGLQIQNTLSAGSLAELRDLPADNILAVQQDCQLGCSGTIKVGPIVDGHFLADTPAQVFAAGQFNDVPLMVGFTRDESSNDLRTAKSLSEFQAAAKRLYGERAQEFLKLYPASNDAEARAMGHTAAREGMIETRMRGWLQAQSRNGAAPAYTFMFSRVHPFAEGVTFYDKPKEIGAYHTSDVPYWLGTQDALNLFRTTRDWTAYDRELSDRMMDCLIAFARTGNPSTTVVTWPQWRPQTEQLVEFGDVVAIRPMDRIRLDFHAAANATPATPRLSRD
jgi:para-nitrobenzyl esterase